MSEYVINMETQKLEMHFDKADYMALSDGQKAEIKSNFLFSRKNSAWVSRCKFPHIYRAEEIAKKLGLENGGKVGELLSYSDQMQIKADRAEAKADRYEARSEKAYQTGEQLQKPIDNMHGDIAFFTQPNINTSSGRAFTRQRDRMFAAWERGFEEFKKSEYYANRAEYLRSSAKEPTDKGFCQRRIEDAEKSIRAQHKNIESYKKQLEKINNGETLKRYSGDIITAEEIERWIEDAEIVIENNISKSIYYHDCIDKLGGVEFSKANIKPGMIVEIARWGNCKVLSTGPKNIKYNVLHINCPLSLTAAYAEIKRIVETV